MDTYFAVGNLSKARNLVIRDYDSTMKIMAKSYDYETAKKLAAELKDKHHLSANFPSFTGYEIRQMCMLHKDDLHVEVWAFMDENCTNLMKNSTEYMKAF